jgi:4-diphosphocytidyl-2-C-methyl-D-erythritol kinase
MTATARAMSAPAKLNLFLRVLGRETDGYHGLETLFCLVDLADDLRAERRDGSGVTIEVEGADVGPPDQNLALRAAAVLRHRQSVQRAPPPRQADSVQAGLGVARRRGRTGAGQPARQQCGAAELLQLGARLSSDVPFCLSGGPLALAWGRGERLLQLPPLPAAPVLLLLPPVPISTAKAYGWVDSARQSAGRRGAVALDLDALSSWGDIGRMAGNDFESPVFGRHPEAAF